jgi:hypothetical protein
MSTKRPNGKSSAHKGACSGKDATQKAPKSFRFDPFINLDEPLPPTRPVSSEHDLPIGIMRDSLKR